MDLKSALAGTIEPWNLLNHPFYRAWSCGSLSLNRLRTYAEEYGAFIGLLADGWLAQDDPETAQEEREHVELWEDFAKTLGTRVTSPRVPEVKNLVTTARRLFRDYAEAAGAMYAFEFQQPATAKSKLDGLRAFYELPEAAQAYFLEHQNNGHEAEKLFKRMSQMKAPEQADAIEACEEMSRALWEALTGIYGGDSQQETSRPSA